MTTLLVTAVVAAAAGGLIGFVIAGAHRAGRRPDAARALYANRIAAAVSAAIEKVARADHVGFINACLAGLTELRTEILAGATDEAVASVNGLIDMCRRERDREQP